MEAQVNRRLIRRRIRHRIRKVVSGTAQRPRLAVYRSQKHIYVQAIDDGTGRTLAHASSLDSEARAKVNGGAGVQAATVVGTLIAERLAKSGIASVVFDRGGFHYHGRVKALAEAARAGGLRF